MEPKLCPKCKHEMQALLFMGVQLEGYVCPHCKILYPVDDEGNMDEKPLATVI